MNCSCFCCASSKRTMHLLPLLSFLYVVYFSVAFEGQISHKRNKLRYEYTDFHFKVMAPTQWRGLNLLKTEDKRSS